MDQRKKGNVLRRELDTTPRSDTGSRPSGVRQAGKKGRRAPVGRAFPVLETLWSEGFVERDV
eukprot:3934442-Rhodomonas_salina.2